MKIHLVGAEFSHADRWRHVTKLIFAFHSFAEVPKDPSTLGSWNLNTMALSGSRCLKLQAVEFFRKTVNKPLQNFVNFKGLTETDGESWLVLSSGNFRTDQRWYILQKQWEDTEPSQLTCVSHLLCGCVVFCRLGFYVKSC